MENVSVELIAPTSETGAAAEAEAALLVPAEIADNLPLPASRARMIAGSLALVLPVVVSVGLVTGITGITAVALALAVAKVLWPFALIAGALAWLRRKASIERGFIRRCAAAHDAMTRGQLRRAEALCREMCIEVERQPSLAAVARLTLASVQRRSGELEAATATLMEVEHQRGLAALDPARGQVAAALAYVMALRGEVDAAREWLRRTELWMHHSKPWTYPGLGGYDLTVPRALAEMAIAARAGEFDACVRTFDEALPAFEHGFSVSQMKPVWALRAFVAARGAGPRDIGAAEPWLRHLRGARPDEVAFLGAAWSEMQAFLAAAG